MLDKRYSEVIKLATFAERLEYLLLTGVSVESPRDISEAFYKSRMWKAVREDIAKRDLGCDLGVFGIYIYGSIYVHHINPITQKDIENNVFRKLYDPENLICTSLDTHNIIHYRKEIETTYVDRSPGDTKLWQRRNSTYGC